MSQPAVKRQRNTEMLRAPSVRDAGMSMLLLLAGRASVLGLFPFGVAFFASCFDKSIAYLGITVLSIALMTSAGSAVLTKYLVAALLFWIYTRFRNKENLVLDAACVGGAVMVGGFVFLIYTYVGAYDILMLFVEAIVTSLMYIIFKKAHGLIANRKKRTQTAQDELISISVSVGVFITGLSGIVFPYNISLANIVSVYAVLCIALASKPAMDYDICVGCGECARCCPPKAIDMSSGKPVIDTKICIKCFCCQELCPKKAVKIKRPLLNRFMIKFLK